jgi:glucose/arabinose dehydrogenase
MIWRAAGLGFALLAGIASAQAPTLSPGARQEAEMAALFADNCSGCHGAGRAGGRGPDLFDPRLLSKRSDAEMLAKIRKGVEGAEMPAFDGILEEAKIYQLIAWLRIKSAAGETKPAFVADPDNMIIQSEKQKFRIKVVARGLDTPWGLAFLPDGRTLVTERAGRLRIIDKAGNLLPAAVAGTPAVWVRQDGGLLDVAVHPDYARNGWIYIGYSELLPGYVIPPNPMPLPDGRMPNHPSMTVIVRGKIDAANRWTDQEDIFRGPTTLYSADGSHYGTRFGFGADGKFYYSIGDRGEKAHAQTLGDPLGKVHRVNDDGSVPADNPFVGKAGAVPTIWSWGHRNPQGLSWDARSGLLWETEHGPVGGDEINIVEKARNYGWGVISAGLEPGITRREAPGMEQPITHYTPRIAPSGIHVYAGNRYPGWRHNLFVAGLAGRQLRRLEIDGRRITHQEVLFNQFGRARAVTSGPDGLIYVLLQSATGAGTPFPTSASPGLVVRLEPVP